MDLHELEEIMSLKDFNKYVELFKREEEIYTTEWFELEEMKEELLEKYDLDYPQDSYELESDYYYY